MRGWWPRGLGLRGWISFMLSDGESVTMEMCDIGALQVVSGKRLL